MTRPELEHARSRAAHASRATPARILAEGDSWFDLPLKSDIVRELRQRSNLSITSIAHYGNTMQQMVGWPGASLFHALRNNEYDLLLFSGGGNDILSDGSLRTFLRPGRVGHTPADLPGDMIDMTLLGKRLARLERLYDSLLENVARMSRNPSIQVVTHTYDFVWPRHAPYCVPASLVAAFASYLAVPAQGNVPVRGPWLEPILRQRGILDATERHEIVKRMLLAFRDLLERVAARSSGRLVVVDTQGTLGPGHWSDEIHPDAAGARLLAGKLYAHGIQPLLAATTQGAG